MHADSERGFSMLRKVHTDQRPSLKQSTDSIFSEELLTKCKKATVLHKIHLLIYSINVHGCGWGMVMLIRGMVIKL